MAWRKWIVRGLVFSILIGVAGALWIYQRWTNPTAVRQQVINKLHALFPGATVTLISQTRGTSLDTTANANGDFVLVDVTQDTYTVKVTMDGFKTLERRDIPVSAGDRVALGTLTIQLGALAETVLVSGEAPLIQANSGERSFTASRKSN